MNSYLEKIYNRVTEKLGNLASFLPAIGKSIKKAIAAGDVAAVEARATEIDEAADAMKALAANLRGAVADGEVDLVEGADAAVALEKVLDEFEDIIKGYDEDDLAADPEG